MKKYSIAIFLLLTILAISIPTGFAYASEGDDRYGDDSRDDDRYGDDSRDDDRYGDDSRDDDREERKEYR